MGSILFFASSTGSDLQPNKTRSRKKYVEIFIVRSYGFFACGERTKNTPLYPKTSRALLPQRCAHPWIFRLRRKNQKHALVPKDKPCAAHAALRLFYCLHLCASTGAALKKPCTFSVHGFFFVGYTGFEPVTSALSRQRSKPTELIAPAEFKDTRWGCFGVQIV